MNHHYRSYSEQLQPQQNQLNQHLLINQSQNHSCLTNNNQQQLGDQHLQQQQQLSNGQSGSIIRIHSDSQQSLDRLFNPINTQTTVPLRNRNLPASFFNPSWQTNNSNINNIDNNTADIKPSIDSNVSSDNLNRQTTNTTNGFNQPQQGFHFRSVSLFEPRVRGGGPNNITTTTTTSNNLNGSNNNSNNNLNNIQQQQQQPSIGPTAMIVQQHTNVHMRTRSTLAPMTGPNSFSVQPSINNSGNNQQFLNNNNNNNNNNNSNNLQQLATQPPMQQQQNLHNRSISMFVQRPRETLDETNNMQQQQPTQALLPQNVNMHMRTGSGLAPMTNGSNGNTGIQASLSGSNQYLNNNNNHQHQTQLQNTPQATQQEQFSYYSSSTSSSTNHEPITTTSTSTDIAFVDDGSTAMDQCYIQQESIMSPNYIDGGGGGGMSDPIQQQFHITHSQPYIPYNPSLSTSSGSLNPLSHTTPSSTSSSNENNSSLDISNGASSTIVQHHTTSKSWIHQTEHQQQQQNVYFGYR